MGGGLGATSLAINKMKYTKSFNLILILFLLSFSHCYYNQSVSTTNKDSSIKEMEKVNFISVPYEEPFPQLSYYYSYNFGSLNDRIDNIKEFLSNLYAQGFNIKAAWFFAGGSCGNTNTFVSPQLIVQLEENDFDLINFNFSSLSEKPKIKCDKSVSKYIPVK